MVEVTPERIDFLGPGQVFVFGSNLAGRHGKGAALLARQKFGAIYGQGKGLQGTSYALPTMDWRIKPLTVEQISNEVSQFLCFAALNPDLHFFMTKIGCGLGGHTIEEIAPLFQQRYIPKNVTLPKEFQ